MKWINEPGVGSITGDYICAVGANDIEVDGECICGTAVSADTPTVEGVSMVGVSLSFCVFALLAVFKRRK